MRDNNIFRNLDWTSIFLFIALSFIGWVSIYSAVSDTPSSIFDTNYPFGKQILFFEISTIIILFLIFINPKIYENFAYVFYGISLLTLLGLFIFGKTISGSTSWYTLFGFGFQPSEFAKIAVALAISKYLSNSQVSFKNPKHLFISVSLVLITSVAIALQPDPGTAIVFIFAFLIIFFSYGISLSYLFLGISFFLVFIFTLKVGTIKVLIASAILAIILFLLDGNRRKHFKLMFLALVGISLVSYFSIFIFQNTFKQHHRDRIVLWLNIENVENTNKTTLRKTIGYNTHQSQTAISSGGFYGKGYLKGNRTKGNFIPEQHTDYIFSTIGEEWGFLGSFVILSLYTLFILRILFIAENQKSMFTKIYGYCIASIFFIHYVINIGMVIGLLPTVGIPLPFISYGGSAYISFSIMLFIFLRLDANRRNDWLL